MSVRERKRTHKATMGRLWTLDCFFHCTLHFLSPDLSPVALAKGEAVRPALAKGDALCTDFPIPFIPVRSNSRVYRNKRDSGDKRKKISVWSLTFYV